MEANENTRNDTSEEVIVLGVASTETKGSGPSSEGTGYGLPFIPGISEE